MSYPVAANPNLPLAGYLPAAPQMRPANSPPRPGFAPTGYQPMMPPNSRYAATNLGQGPLVQTGAAGVLSTATKVVPGGTAAAVGAATAIANNSSRAMSNRVAAIVGEAGEPLLKLSWGLVTNLFDVLGSTLTLRLGDAARAFGRIFSEGAVNLGGLGKKLFQPLTLTSETMSGTRLGMGQAIGAGLSGGMQAFKTCFIWAIPASAVNAFIDYKYRDQSDVKRLGTNFVADVIGYTASGMAGAAAGAAIGSMTLPIVGTIVGAGVGILLGLAHDKITRPMISDVLRDQLG